VNDFKCTECGCTNYHDLGDDIYKCNICGLAIYSYTAPSQLMKDLKEYCFTKNIPLKIDDPNRIIYTTSTDGYTEGRNAAKIRDFLNDTTGVVPSYHISPINYARFYRIIA
jgi:hypothetical protein